MELSQVIAAGNRRARWSRIARGNPVVAYNGNDPSATGRYPQPGWCASFDGNGDYIDCGDVTVFDGATKLKYSGYFYADTVGAQRPLLGKWLTTGIMRGVIVDIYNGNLRFIMGYTTSASVVLSTTVTASAWHYFEASWDAATQQMTLSLDNGTPVTAGIGLGAFINNNEPLTIGTKTDNGARLAHFAGRMAGIKCWADDVLVGQYNLDHANGTLAYDSSGNGNHGTLQGATFAVDNSIPRSFPNQDGFSSGYENRIPRSSDLNDASWTKAGVSCTYSGDWCELTKNETSGSRSANTPVASLPAGDSTVYMSLKGGTSSQVEFGLYDGSFQTTTLEVVSGSGVASVSSGLGRVTGLDGNETIIRLVSDTAAAPRFYIYPDLSSPSAIGASVSVKDIQCYAGTGDRPGFIDTVGSEVIPSTLIPRDESNPAQDVLGNALRHSGSVFPVRPVRKNSYAVTFDGSNDYARIANPGWNDTCNVKLWVKLHRVTTEYVVDFRGADSGSGFILSSGGDITSSAGVLVSGFSVGQWYLLDVDMGINTLGDIILAMRNNLSASFRGNVSMCNLQVRDAGDNLVLDMPMSEGVGPVLHDVSGNGHHGTVVNASADTKGAGFWSGRQDVFRHNLEAGFTRARYFNAGSSRYRIDTLSNTFDLHKLSFCMYLPYDLDSNSAGRHILSGSSGNNVLEFRAGSVTSLVSGEVLVFFGVANSRHYTTDPLPRGFYFVEVIHNGTTYEIRLNGVLQTTLHHGGNSLVQCNRAWIGPSSNGGDGIVGAVYRDFKMYSANDTLEFHAPMDGTTSVEKEIVTDTAFVSTSNAQPVMIPSINGLDPWGLPLGNPPVPLGHNGAETVEDCYNISEDGSPVPETNHLGNFAAIQPGDEGTFLRAVSPADTVSRRGLAGEATDRLVVMPAPQSGNDLAHLENYTR